MSHGPQGLAFLSFFFVNGVGDSGQTLKKGLSFGGDRINIWNNTKKKEVSLQVKQLKVFIFAALISHSVQHVYCLLSH